MMTEEKIFEKVQQHMSELLGIEASEIQMDSDFIDDLNADSLDVVDLVLLLEKEFNFQIPDEDAERIHTVGAAVRYISENL
ncbi:MAG: acyl carrier protein [Eubacteriales bacterium]|nr:acyl carrier protein [Eubacteriales bacterium]